MGGLGVQLPFFAYGTLLPGEANFGLWRRAIDDLRPAVMGRARLYDLGGFPMLVDAPEGEVRGMLVRVRPSSYPAALALLDRLEGVDMTPYGGYGYRRLRRIARLAGGSSVVAWVYVGSEAAVAGLEPIGPDWKSYHREHTQSA